LKTIDELDEIEGKEKQMETERAVAAAATVVLSQQAASLSDPFVGLNVPLLPLKV
jgi:hypothetical protein